MVSKSTLLILPVLVVLVLFTLPWACSNGNNNNPSAPTTVFYVPITNTFTSTATPGTPTVTPTHTTVPPHYVNQWGGFGTANGSFEGDIFLALNSAGTTLYVTDYYNNRVQYFSPSGTYLGKWGSAGTSLGQFTNPTGVAVDPAGYVYVADSGNNRVEKFTATGVTVLGWGSVGIGPNQFNGPMGLAYSAAYFEIETVDSGNERVQAASTIGGYAAQYGVPGGGSGNGYFLQPQSVATSGVTDFVADYSNNRIQVFKGGAFAFEWGSFGTGNGQFNSPRGVAVDQSASCGGQPGPCVYVSENGGRIQIFTSNGTYLTQFGSQGNGTGQFDLPTGIAVDAAGNIYVADANNDRVEVFAP